jgi:hypothetical protein
MKSFDISYVSAALDEWNEQAATVEEEVKSDRIRLIQGLPIVEEVKIEESTGRYMLCSLPPPLLLLLLLLLLPTF